MTASNQNIALTDTDIHALSLIIQQWKDAYYCSDVAAEAYGIAIKNRLPAVATRIERELDRALERPETVFE